MRKSIFLLLLIIGLALQGNAQVDSSQILTHMLTGGASKTWFTRPVIVDNPSDLKATTLSFTLHPRTGVFIRHRRGRGIIGNTRDFSDWKIEKIDHAYVLVISKRERYLINLTGKSSLELFIQDIKDGRAVGASIQGHFFETPLLN